MNIYLDIDGVLIKKDGSPADYVVDFLKYITDNYQVFWLTTHCKGDADTAVNYLKGKLPSEAFPFLKKIKPTNWKTLKTEAIDFTQDFRWFDDYSMLSEEKALLDNNSLLRLNKVDLNKHPDSLKIEDYKFKKIEIDKLGISVFFEYKKEYTEDEYEKIRQGYYAPEKGMDVRWRLIFMDDNLYILRSWSDWVAYKLKFKKIGKKYIAKEAYTYFGKTSDDIYWNNHHANFVFILIEQYLFNQDLFFLDNLVSSKFKIDINGLHGFNHWMSVYKNGLMLAEKHGADKEVIKYFAFLHDIERESEFDDPNHGRRAAKIASRFVLDQKQKEQLVEAIKNHNNPNYKTKDKTIMACLDADRMDYDRTGVEVDQKYLFFSSKNRELNFWEKVRLFFKL